MVCQVDNKIIFDGLLVFSFEVQNPKKEKKYRSNMEALWKRVTVEGLTKDFCDEAGMSARDYQPAPLLFQIWLFASDVHMRHSR